MSTQSGNVPTLSSVNGYPEHVKEQAIRLYLEGANFRRIGRLLSVNYQSAVNWVNAYHQSLPVTGEHSDRSRSS